MDEDLLKRNTDCVYFLASPFTCKKGAECEYRHNDMARLNPRDCWYWLSGNCLNPTCAFRHPPLDGQSGVSSEPSESSAPANKTMVPCYYFFNRYCNKGHRCSFLHGPDESLLTVKPLKNDNGSINAVNLENETQSGNKAGVASAPKETHFNQSLSATNALSDFKLKPKDGLQLPLPENVKQQSDDCLEFSSFDCKVAAVNQSNSPFQDDGFAHDNTSPLCTGQSSEQQVNSHIEPEERWESSPGFDVLVHDESDEDDSEYVPVLDMDDQELDEQYLGSEFKDPVESDTLCPDAYILYEQGAHEGYRYFDRDFTNANGGRVCGYSREVILDSILSRKRIRMSACDNNLDLRDHLRRRREIDGPPISGSVRSHDSSSLMFRNQERHQRHGIGQRLSRRLTSQLGFSSIREVENLSIANKHRLFTHSQHNRRRKHYREKVANRQFPSFKMPRNPVLRQRRYIHGSRTFSGPKTLAEIKEEKKKKSEESSHCHFGSSSTNFQDPKPLSEILKDKETMD